MKIPASLNTNHLMSLNIIHFWLFAICFFLFATQEISAQPAAEKPANPAPAPATTTEDTTKKLQADGVSPELLITKDLMTPDLITSYRKDNLPKLFRNAMRNGNLSGNDAEDIKKYVKYSVYRLSQPDERKKIRVIRLDIINTPDNYPASPAKDLYLKEVSQRCMELMDNHLAIRIQAAMILGELNTEKGNPFKGVPPTPYFGNTDSLIQIISDPKQHQAVKLEIVNGMERICRLGATLNKPEPTLRSNMMLAVVKELENGSKYHWWYKKNMIRCLPELRYIYSTVNPRPVVTEILTTYLRNKSEDKLVRAEAAKSLGRILLDGNHNVNVIVYEIVKFSAEMATAFNQNLLDPTYRDCFWTIYLAFHPEDQEEQKKYFGLNAQADKVAIKSFQPVIESGYQTVLILINAIFNDNAPAAGVAAKKIDDAKIKAVTDWLKNNVPKEKSIHINSPPLN